ncbi:hypothetical protein TW81_08970 [Vibrio galatheae]|uniref:RanBP2-type domain-containing protein n=1 Tax=Vibrio galatheae TaxID=579748 RepID=A0A0F4NJ19_9VIBR|nr:DUF2007 domain-containing protein [Vibrio galatheae]KJY83135.1 hypothetical protein TW81_08970 [Vibrio galatheae]
MRIYSASNPAEAHIVCELLKSQRISCEVRGEGIFGLQGEVPLGESSEPFIWLLDSGQVEQAHAVIEQFNCASSGTPWCCTQCGETNEAQFGVCWQCGESAP